MARKRSPNETGRWEITPLGDSALVLRFANDAPEKILDRVGEAMHRIAEASLPGVIDLAPAYNSIGIFFSAPPVVRQAVENEPLLQRRIQQVSALLSKSSRRRQRKVATREIEIPVCFDPEFALDLAQVASAAQLSPNEVVDLYCAARYRVASLGFTPGFPYLVGLPSKLATPRRDSPRKEVPAGSVAIGGNQTGVYPVPSPGGWNVIGRTALRLFDPNQNPPALLHTGDRVRFRPIAREEFERSTS
jgi:inhibitor of KinA